MTRIVAVSGSQREESYTRAALRYALRGAADAGAETDLIDLGAADLPLYHPDRDDGQQGDAVELMARVRRAHGVILGSPVYHGSYSSTFKNFHDYCGSDEFEDTAVGLLTVAGGSAYSSTLDHMRSTVRSVHGHTIPEQVGIPSVYDAFADHTGCGNHYYEFVDQDLRERTETLGRRVAEEAERYALSDPTTADD